MKTFFSLLRDKYITKKQTPWVCYDCGHEGNDGEKCKVCGEKPNTIVTEDGIIEIVHPENISSGFQWSYTVTPKDSLEIIGDINQSRMSLEEQNNSEPSESFDDVGELLDGVSTPLDGVGGTHTYRFRPIKDGKITLCFTLARGRDEIDSELIYTYEVKNLIPTRVSGEINTWVCDCGYTHNRFEQVCYACERAMPGLEDGWFCSECGHCHTKDEEECPNCGEVRTYANNWICTCGYAVLDGYIKSCERCDTMPPSYPKAWVCAECDNINVTEEPCEVCGEPNDHSSDIWICECRHINNLSSPPEEWSDVCTRCGKSRPVAGQK